jgi:hypothetical protein
VLHIAGWTADKFTARVSIEQAGYVVGLDGVAAKAIEDSRFEKHVIFDFELVAHVFVSLFVAGNVKKL